MTTDATRSLVIEKELPHPPEKIGGLSRKAS